MLKPDTIEESGKFVLLILATAQLFGLSLWFAPNSVIDQLIPLYSLTESDLGQLSIIVTVGFVIGGLIFSFSNISDLIKSKNLFLYSSVFGGISNFLTIFMNNFVLILILRFFTGISLAGIYPIGMKITSEHFKKNRGLAFGILLSALTVGSGLPYLLLLFGTPDWKIIITITSVIAILGGLMVKIFVHDGPFTAKKTEFDIGIVKKIYSKKSVILANLAYFGHMWELYAFWVWFPRMLQASYKTNFKNAANEEIIQFFAVGSFLIFLFGGFANVIGGYIADRIGRTLFNTIVLSISGSSALLIGFFFSRPNYILFLGIIWGITIIPDSPQYSTIVTEVSDRSNVGAALTMQTAIGFSITIVSISLVPIFLNTFGWSYVFMFLAIGPIVGIISSILLRRQPDAYLIANGLK